MIGTTISHYRIVELIGRGGMGEVYKAEDLTLKRLVALKFLSPELTRDPLAVERFIREAQTASALDHQNICTVHEISQSDDGRYFIVMAYYEGETLRRRISAAPVDIETALGIARQLCRGLEKAHAKGIIHRDLKPENIIITLEGDIKILDFGVAELVSRQSDPGSTSGTLAYMSPEQLMGKVFDFRTDIWAVGVILYEMLKGYHPFRGDFKEEVIYSILNEEPEPIGETENPVQRLITGLLCKEPKRRYQNIAKVQSDLQLLVGEEEAHLSTLSKKQRRKKRLLTFVFIPFLIALVFLIVYWYRQRDEPEQNYRIRQFTSFPGVEDDPAFSPDGKKLAFCANMDGFDGRDIYIKPVAGGDIQRLTQFYSAMCPVWSPDGKTIAFGIAFTHNDGIYTIPSAGGDTTKLFAVEWYRYWPKRMLTWSPDGKYIAYPQKDSLSAQRRICLYSFKTQKRTKLTSPPDDYVGDLYCAFSPDGSLLAFIRQRSYRKCDIYIIPTEGGKEKQLTFENTSIYSCVWSQDGRDIIFAANRIGEYGLWRISAKGGSIKSLSVGEGYSVAIARTINMLAYVKDSTPPVDIYRIDNPLNSMTRDKPTAVVQSSAGDYSPSISPDGEKIVFVSNRTGLPQIWRCDIDGKHFQQLTYFDAGCDGSPQWSPDSRYIAFSSTASGNSNIAIMTANGDSVRAVVEDPSNDKKPTWSRDGQSIYYASDRGGEYQIWKKSLFDGEPVQITRDGALIGYEAVDGNSLYYMRRDRSGVWRTSLISEKTEKILDTYVTRTSWQVFDDGIYFLQFRTEDLFISFYDFKSSVIKPVVKIDQNSGNLAVSPDRFFFLVNRGGGLERDIMLVENFK